jgi:hypothetical protein
MESGIIPDGKLQHLISDAATMQIIRWTKGGFGMAAHNYDGGMYVCIHVCMHACMYFDVCITFLLALFLFTLVFIHE